MDGSQVNGLAPEKSFLRSHSYASQHPVTSYSFPPVFWVYSLRGEFKTASILNKKNIPWLEISDEKRFMNAPKRVAT